MPAVPSPSISRTSADLRRSTSATVSSSTPASTAALAMMSSSRMRKPSAFATDSAASCAPAASVEEMHTTFADTAGNSIARAGVTGARLGNGAKSARRPRVLLVRGSRLARRVGPRSGQRHLLGRGCVGTGRVRLLAARGIRLAANPPLRPRAHAHTRARAHARAAPPFGPTHQPDSRLDQPTSPTPVWTNPPAGLPLGVTSGPRRPTRTLVHATTSRAEREGDNRAMPADSGGVALVLAGGGARGAYEIGALSVLLPALERRGERVEGLVGASVGTINCAFLAATAGEGVTSSLEQARELWSELAWDEALRPLLSPAELAKLATFLLPGGRVWGFLDPAP